MQWNFDVVNRTLKCNNIIDGPHNLRPDHQRYDRYGNSDMLRSITGTGLNFILKPEVIFENTSNFSLR